MLLRLHAVQRYVDELRFDLLQKSNSLVVAKRHVGEDDEVEIQLHALPTDAFEIRMHHRLATGKMDGQPVHGAKLLQRLLHQLHRQKIPLSLRDVAMYAPLRASIGKVDMQVRRNTMPIQEIFKRRIVFFTTRRTDILPVHWDNGRLARCSHSTLIPRTLRESLRNQFVQNHAEIILNIHLRAIKFRRDGLPDFRFPTPFPANLLKERPYIPHNRASARSRAPYDAPISNMA